MSKKAIKDRAETSCTLETPREAAAFMLGYNLAKFSFHDTEARIDPEEPQTVLLNMDTEDEAEHYRGAKALEAMPQD